ncbi:type II toxin-antitoxin system VapC family toxin [Pelomonas sp. V22]|uniref:type II toxin-antitoxin system VapC family toxin n=1 Tax=Pelomonas sp. V22 TaxID=2822139 RepID=UPI0024A9C628|nr:type II toxin-antitoxin system VapC family toxin [Pelomonas sp. V22]MDI4631655.1 type II toxin-antitoxin system VapC family toxin [Pelomonas sp. V22]
MIAVDSSVLIDVLTGDTEFGEASAVVLAQALGEGDVVISEAVVAEIQTVLDTRETVMDALNEFGIRFEPIQEAAAVRAGHMQRRYRDRGGKRERVVADFLIGAHALLQCKALITRDEGFFRDYYKGLKLIVPQPL